MSPDAAPSGRWAWAEIDRQAISDNVAELTRRVSPSSVCAVVKAEGYGHGAMVAASAALDGGASMLAVALAGEGIALRRAGIDPKVPILVLSQQPPALFPAMVAARLIPTLYASPAIAEFAAAVRAAGVDGYGVQLKFDTGMHRVGARPADAPTLAAAVVAEAPVLRLDGVFTHLAVADEPDDRYTGEQLDRFDELLAALRRAGVDPGLIHAANSAGAIAHPRSRYAMVRTGIAIYGIAPGPRLAEAIAGLRPAMRLVARVGWVKRVAAGDRMSYGLRYTAERPTTIATVPLGYADGVPRRLSSTGGEVLLGGRRCPIAGVVTMDQLLVDCGDDPVAVGDEVVLLGAQGGQRIGPEEWADRLGTIAYEIVCGIAGRIERTTQRR